MIVRSFDPNELKEAFKLGPHDNSSIDCEAWLNNYKNVMLVEGNNVGIATYEYPGVYTVHWFYNVRGREAIKLAREMLDEMFNKYGCETARGLTPTNLKAARWLAKQVGLTSYGMMTCTNGEEVELMFITKEEFNNGRR